MNEQDVLCIMAAILATTGMSLEFAVRDAIEIARLLGDDLASRARQETERRIASGKRKS